MFRVPVLPAEILQLSKDRHYPICLPRLDYTSGPDFHDHSVSPAQRDVPGCSREPSGAGHTLCRERTAKCSLHSPCQPASSLL